VVCKVLSADPEGSAKLFLSYFYKSEGILLYWLYNTFDQMRFYGLNETGKMEINDIYFLNSFWKISLSLLSTSVVVYTRENLR